MAAPLLGYCTNVHAGSNLAETRSQLERYATAVKAKHSPNQAMGVGLWLSASSASALRDQQGELESFRDWLSEAGLRPYTLNGFPYGDFHGTRVKHAVYRPDWSEEARVEYTLNLIDILHNVLPTGAIGSISTVPLGWGRPAPSESWLDACGRNLDRIVDRLAWLESETGRLIHLDLEPEPGCVLEYSWAVADWMQGCWRRGSLKSEAKSRRYLRVCHDVCHAAVMFEDQVEAWQGYRSAGIEVGKVQVSSAIAMPLGKCDSERKTRALHALAEFVEERYLHQTVTRSPSGATLFHEDLPHALRMIEGQNPCDLVDEWRVHFHVPIFLEHIHPLETTQSMTLECLDQLRSMISAQETELPHIEVETYAWSVLPSDLRGSDDDNPLATGIARELDWLRDQLKGDL